MNSQTKKVIYWALLSSVPLAVWVFSPRQLAQGSSAIPAISIAPEPVRATVLATISGHTEAVSLMDPSEKQPVPSLRQNPSSTTPIRAAAAETIDATLTAPDTETFDRLVRKLQDKGIRILDSLPRLRTVRVHLPSTDVLDDFRRDTELSFEYQDNFYVYAPADPRSFAQEASGPDFSGDAVHWLGLQGDNSTWGEGVIVAVLDTGVSEHPALNAGNIRTIDLVGEGTPEGDYAGHATAVCSLLAGNGNGVAGVAPGTSILSIQVLDSYGVGDAFTLAQGILRAVDEGADVINLSLGAEGDSHAVREAVAYALQAGVAVIAAAGNSGTDDINYPARYEGVAAVGSVDAHGEREEYTNTGNEIDILAPGAAVDAAWGEGTVAFSGTSASAPYVTGTVASLLSMDPEMTPAAALQEVLANADDNGAPGFDPQYGNGVLDIGRLQRRDTEDIVDVALSGHFLPVEVLQGESLPVLVSAENRGTTSLPQLTVSTNLAGQQLNTEFSDVSPGETVSVTLLLDTELLREEGNAKLQSRVIIPENTDINRNNDFRASTITLKTAEDTDNPENP